jgi:hypothetical protein
MFGEVDGSHITQKYDFEKHFVSDHIFKNLLKFRQSFFIKKYDFREVITSNHIFSKVHVPVGL